MINGKMNNTNSTINASLKSTVSGGTKAVWGKISGDINEQTDLIDLLDTYQPIINEDNKLSANYIDGLSEVAIPERVKTALLSLLENVAFINSLGLDYYSELEDALYNTTTLGIEAVFNQGQNEIFTTNTLDDLREYLTVIVNKSDGTSKEITNYTLRGELTRGVSTITVLYKDFTATFTVDVTLDTTAKIAYSGSIYTYTSNSIQITTMANGGCTVDYLLDPTVNGGSLNGIIPTQGTIIVNNGANCNYLTSSKTHITHTNENTGSGGNATSGYNRWAQYQAGTMTEFARDLPALVQATPCVYINFSVDTRYLDRAYMYVTQTGQVIFAGRNTPYWGMENINEANQ